MSHFTVLCIFPNKPADTESAVEEALSPYSENVEVPRYRRKCWCVGQKAEDHVGKTHTQPAFEKARREFKEPAYDKEKYPIFGPKNVQRQWSDYTAPILKEAERLVKEHELYEKPDPECDECKGSGKVWSTSNPRGYYDWYAIGGRWNGLLNGKDERPLKEIIQKIADEKDDGGKTDNFTFALCIDGDWYAAGKMLMFALVADENFDFGAEYVKLCKDYLNTHPEAYCVLVDCHS